MLSKRRVGTLRYDAMAACGPLNVSFSWPGSAEMARASRGDWWGPEELCGDHTPPCLGPDRQCGSWNGPGVAAAVTTSF